MKYPLEERLIWFRGEMVPIKDAKVMVFSPTSQFGLNVFEGIPCYWNDEKKQLYGFRLLDHYNRLIKSAHLLQIKCPYTTDNMFNALKETINANDISENISVRQTLFVDDFGSWSSEGPTSMFVVATPKSMISSEYNQEGLNVCFTSWRRISDNTISPRIKCGANYINSRMGQREAFRNGYNTCLFLNEIGKIAEGPGSCFVMVKNNTLVTPMLTDSVLESITRDSVIKIAKKLGYKVKERTIDRTEVYTADEAFLCGSAMGITPIFSIDRYQIGENIGKITKEIKTKYFDIAFGRNNNYSEWITEL
jgi:branched-chain amino acid aminotransferase, group I